MSELPRRDLVHVEEVMGTRVSIDIRSSTDPEAAVREVVAWLQHVDDTFSPYREDSVVTAIGRGELDIDDAGPEIADVLSLCEEVAIDSGGAFDVFAVPAPNGTHFDPSGLVKGWSIERAARLLERRGCEHFCINGGGDIAVRGSALPRTGWRAGVTDPGDAQALLCVVETEGSLAIATSGTYERGAHIVDPRTRQQTTAIASATVIGPDLAMADGYATAMFVLADDAVGWIATRPGYEGLIVRHDKSQEWTPGFAKMTVRPTPASQG